MRIRGSVTSVGRRNWAVRAGGIVAALAVLSLFLCACAAPGVGEEQSIRRRCREIVSLYRDLYDGAQKQQPADRWEEQTLSQQSIDAIEDRLLEKGLDMIDSSADCPSYFVNADHFYQFWEAVQRGENASQEIIAIRASGALSYRLLRHQDGVTYVYGLISSLDGTEDADYEMHQVYGAELTEQGNFYYRINPEDDPHYANYARIRLKKPDQELWELYSKYILAGGYSATNIFLTDWTEADFTKLCFNDVWEYLYRYRNGTQFWPDGCAYDKSRNCYLIPAAEFESAVLPFFKLDVQALRELADYDAQTDCYPWRQVESNDYAFYLTYYTIEPEVTASQTNADGTLALTVQARCTDLSIDCLFSHEVTVRPLADGGFQFVGNRVLTQTEKGLPYCEPRLTWDIAG